jgi:hypothetical protein
MVKFTISGIGTDLGPINSGCGFTLSQFEGETLTFVRRGQKNTTVKVRDIISNALTYIENNCAASRPCNNYFLGLSKRAPISLADILKTKTLQIFRLEPPEDKRLQDLPGGFTFAWGDNYAQIGLNELMLTDTMSAASVLLHELAHVAGAPGRREDPKSIAAETALLKCGMRKYFDKDALGMIESVGSDETRFA